ncbi:MAG: leucine-rich repeat domain-containing protein [Bacteroidia bacterium]
MRNSFVAYGMGILLCMANFCFPNRMQAQVQPPSKEQESEESIAMEGGHEELSEGPPSYQIELWVRGASSPETFTDIKQAQKKAKDAVILQFQSINGGYLPEGISHFKNLEYLYLEFPDSTVLPSQLWKLTNLRKLSIYGWKGVSISPEIARLKNLQSLSIVGTSDFTTRVPEELGSMKSLNSLILRDSKVMELPSHFDLPNLKFFECEGLGMNGFPSGLENSPLDTLILTMCHLEEIPGRIGKLKQLKHLGLAGNSLHTLPSEIGELGALQSLHLSFQNIQSLPPEFGNLHALRLLDMSWAKLDTLPSSICQLENLEILELYACSLQSLPACIGGMHGLKEFILTGSDIDFLPASIGELQNLERLFLADNELVALPEAIGRLTQLRELNLTNNPLRVLPRQVLDLEKLEGFECERAGLLESGPEVWAFLNRTGHRIPEIPTEIAAKPLSYYLERPDIDLASKMYVQGNLKLTMDALSTGILDSVLTSNPETLPFYAHLFMSCLRPSKGSGFTEFSYFPNSNHMEELSGALVKQHPCWFIENVMRGPYSDRYLNWVENGRFSPAGDGLTVDEALGEMRKTVENQCPSIGMEALDQLEEDLENAW